MGRNSESGKSKFIIARKNFGPVLEMHGYPCDEESDAVADLKDCLEDYYVAFVEKDSRGRLVFEVRDQGSPEDFSWELLENIAPYLETGSFYESVGDYFIRCEFAAKKMKVKTYEVEYDEDSDSLIPGELIKEEEGLDPDMPGSMKVELLESLYVIPLARLDDLNENLKSRKKKFKDTRDRVLRVVSDMGWQLIDENSAEMRFRQSAESFCDDFNNPGAFFVSDFMSIFCFGEVMTDESFVRFRLSGKEHLYRIAKEAGTSREISWVEQYLDGASEHESRGLCEELKISSSRDPLRVDGSHWKAKDKKWLAAREKNWPEVMKSLGEHKKTNKGFNIVKQYYLKGKLPNWQTVAEGWKFDETYRHLDLFSILYCHPQQDYDTLKPIVDGYLSSTDFGRSLRDVVAGVRILNELGVYCPSRNGEAYVTELADGGEEPYIKPFDCDAELFTRLIFSQAIETPEKNDLYRYIILTAPSSKELQFAVDWLKLDRLNAAGKKMILQYPCALEAMYLGFRAQYENKSLYPVLKPEEAYRSVLETILDFDTGKEVDSPRTRFVEAIRKMLDEREWIPHIDQAWRELKG